MYAELGSTWRTVMGSPDEAAHVLGKLLVTFGPERILWGTDSIWYGSPQDQIAAFRSFEITPVFQERFGYPALTAEVKRRILGHNAIELFAITPPATTCVPEQDAAGLRRANRTLGPGVAAGHRGDVRARAPLDAIRSLSAPPDGCRPGVVTPGPRPSRRRSGSGCRTCRRTPP